MYPRTIAEFLCRALILLIVFPAHELAHAVAATRLGDPTPRLHGRLTLNPIKHLDPWGSLLFLFAGIGWASTPVNPAYFGENRRLKMGLVSLTGPAANFGLAVLGAVPLYFFSWTPTLTSTNALLPEPAYFFTLFVYLNLLLAFFNLIPIAPLDGAQILGAVLPEGLAVKYESAQRYGFYALLILFFVLPMMGVSVVGLLVRFLVAPVFLLLFLGLP
ncbi:MAG: site-2 protease family protein [Anaerolineales bacterium]|nr:site-2 protease family protein [Anaerolineales bacterium]